MYKNNIIQDFSPEIHFIKNNNGDIIGYKVDTINTNMENVDNKSLIKFYRSFTTKMRDNKLCFFDMNLHNLGYIEKDKTKIVKLIDIDLLISASKLFPDYDELPVSNINLKWHKSDGIDKYQKIIKSFNLSDMELYNFYKKKM